MTALNRILRAITGLLEFVVQKFAVVLIIALVVVITLQIVFRVFFSAFSWSDEVSRFLLIYLSMFGSALAYNKGTHISVRLFQDRLPERAARWMDTLIHGLCLVFFVLLIEYSIMLIMRQRFQVSGAIRVPMQYIYLSIPVSVSIMVVFCLTKITGNLAALFGGRTAS